MLVFLLTKLGIYCLHVPISPLAAEEAATTCDVINVNCTLNVA
jgi:hypothetical protein